jgi:hypothetical protein
MDATLSSSYTTNESFPKKRKGDAISSPDENDNNLFSKFLVITAGDKEPIKFSIFVVQKLLKCAVGDVPCAKKLANGSILLEVASKAQERSALAMKQWVDVPITVTPHRSLNSSRGVIRCREFRDCDDSEVMDALRSQGVSEVKHIFAKRNDKNEPTNTFILTFNSPTPPKYVKAAYMKIVVDPYIPNPLRCYQCQKFGHGKNSCRRAAVCAKCGQEGHEDTSCQNPVHCANCSGSHAAFSKQCPVWAKQRDITKIKYEKNISFFEAKQLVEQSAKYVSCPSGAPGARRAGMTYSKACVQTHEIATQTELTWPIESKMPMSIHNVVSQKHTTIQTQTLAVDKPSTSTQITHENPTIPSNEASGGITQTKDSSSKKPNKPGPASKKTGNRFPKGSNDPVSRFNRFGALDNDMDCENPRSKSKSPRTRKKSA